ncbi:MAG: DNA methyltransferase, partial [Desulfosudaceae bacterium]
MKEQKLFKTKFVRGEKGSGQLFDEEFETQGEPVTCLGMTFENDEARRAYFTEQLRQKLKDPEFRKIEGFPLGSDEAILDLSDPPYYTACPNPWIKDFIAEWEDQKPEKPEGYQYHREPFAADVSEGKNDPIYNAHSYHTKVPHKAIMRYILHYTEPGDIVFDGFCGTGMTGVAAKMCGNKEVVTSLGYQVKPDGTILQEEFDENGEKDWKPFSKLGARRAALNELSPAATFIAYNYNTPVDVITFEEEAKRILEEVEKECGWMYETVHTDGKTKGKINYTVWSDIFVCRECGQEFIYWDVAVNKNKGEVKDIFDCPGCSFEIAKKNAERAYESFYDSKTEKVIRIVKQSPVLINYSTDKKRYEKRPDEFDLKTIDAINRSEIGYSFPTTKIEEGAKTREPITFGATYTHLMYTKRNLWILSSVFSKTENINDRRLSHYLKVWFTSSQTRLHRMNRYAAKHQRHVGPLANTLYISSTPAEISPFYFLSLKIKENSLSITNKKQSVTQTGDAANVIMPENSIDYIFIDPPFGQNIMYSDLNILWESWLSVKTNPKPEAIENKYQKKDLNNYRQLMLLAFINAFKALKPGHWITVEFSNTKAAVWNSIQSALTDAGFVVANVAALNKGRGGLHAIIGPTAVKQDLVISAYKPNGGFEERFQKEAQT